MMNDQTPTLSVRETLIAECSAMIKYSLARGLNISPDLVALFEEFSPDKTTQGASANTPPPNISRLVGLYEELCKIVEPSTPRSIYLLEKEIAKKSHFKFIGNIPLIRRMWFISIFSLIIFIALSLSPHIDAKPENWDPFKSFGIDLLIRELFLLTAASVGVTFSNLYKAKHIIDEGAFTSTTESLYWTQYILGILSGFLLANMIPIERSIQSDFGKPLLAILGGFSADVVYQILNRFVEAVKSLVNQDLQATFESQKQSLKARLSEEETKTRFQLASELMKIQQMIDSNTTPNEIKQKMTDMVNRTLDKMDMINPVTTTIPDPVQQPINTPQTPLPQNSTPTTPTP